MELHATLGVLGAKSCADRARVLALSTDARLVIGTLAVASAFRLWLLRFVALRYALHERRTSMASRTRTYRRVIDYTTQRIDTTCTDARILAPLIVACSIGGTVGVDDTFRILAFCTISNHAANTVGTAGRRVTRILWRCKLALDERITDHVPWARADRTVVDRVAFGSVTTHAWTGIDAFFVDARSIPRTVAVNHALGVTAPAERTSLELGQAFANSITVEYTAHRVLATGRWIAWV